MISARIIADSIHPFGTRLTTFVLTYPRFIHSEFMTHRAFSRNAASSRAIPIERMMKAIEENPAWPEQWGSNQPGMQAGEPLSPVLAHDCRDELKFVLETALDAVQAVSKLGLHKQVANRYLEAWSHITVIATATDRGLSNFFALRAHAAAQPEFQILAFRMLAAYLASQPRKLPWGGWHIPFQDREDAIYQGSIENNGAIIKAAVGRIASVSYNRQDIDDAAKNVALHDRLAAAGHWSPFEHVAMAWGSHPNSNFDIGYGDGATTGKLSGWRQYRKSFVGENQAQADLPALMAAKPEWVTL